MVKESFNSSGNAFLVVFVALSIVKLAGVFAG
jgi:hypothetical protein